MTGFDLGAALSARDQRTAASTIRAVVSLIRRYLLARPPATIATLLDEMATSIEKTLGPPPEIDLKVDADPVVPGRFTISGWPYPGVPVEVADVRVNLPTRPEISGPEDGDPPADRSPTRKETTPQRLGDRLAGPGVTAEAFREIVRHQLEIHKAPADDLTLSACVTALAGFRIEAALDRELLLLLAHAVTRSSPHDGAVLEALEDAYATAGLPAPSDDCVCPACTP